MSDSPIELSGLSKKFGRRYALEQVSLRVAPGEVVGLLGPNGAGKTPALKCLLGLLRPTAGVARVMGLDAEKEPVEVKRRLGYVPDEPQFFDKLTGREHLGFAVSMYQIDRDAAWARIAPLVDALGFNGELGRRTGTYSLGNRKKLAFVLALLHAPPVLLLDEPFNGLDPWSASLLKEELRERAKAGVAVLMSTHQLDAAEKLCGRVIVLHQGTLCAEGTLDEIRALAHAAPTATLEEAFLALVEEASAAGDPAAPAPKSA